MPTKPIDVALETTATKTFAAALEWPGCCPSGRDAALALPALAARAERYRPVAAAAGCPLPERVTLHEVQRMPGGATTAFGAPEVTFDADRAAVPAADSRRLAALVRASWDHLDDVAAHAPAE